MIRYKVQRGRAGIRNTLQSAAEKRWPPWHHKNERHDDGQRMTPMAPELLGQLYRQHAPALRLYARQWPGHAEDLVQVAFVKLAQQTAPPEHVVPWLYRVVRNAAFQAGRSAARRRQRESAVSTPETWFTAVDDQLDAREAVRLLADLPLELREAIVARIWGGLTFAEIATLTGCSLPTAHRRYQAGLTVLRERLEKPCTPTLRNQMT